MCKVYTKEHSEPLENRLKEFCDKHNINLNPNADIVLTCRAQGFNVFKMPLDDVKLDGVILVKGTKKIIGINSSLSGTNSRFVLAHEFAHYISNPNTIFAMRDRVLHGEEKSDTENDMDYIAAAILVQKEHFLKDLKELKVDVAEYKGFEPEDVIEKVSPTILDFLSDKYNVTKEVITRRIAEVAYYV